MSKSNKLVAESVEPIKPVAVTLPPIPPEDVGGGYDDGEDFGAGDIPVIARPAPDEWITIRRDAAIGVRLLRQQKPGRTFETSYHYVVPSLRREVADELKAFTVVPAYSWLRRKVFLYVVPVAEAGVSGWGDALIRLLGQSAEWHASRAVKIKALKEEARYRIKAKPAPGEVRWPPEDTGALLATALGEARIIKTADHPVYLALLEGEEVG